MKIFVYFTFRLVYDKLIETNFIISLRSYAIYQSENEKFSSYCVWCTILCKVLLILHNFISPLCFLSKLGRCQFLSHIANFLPFGNKDVIHPYNGNFKLKAKIVSKFCRSLAQSVYFPLYWVFHHIDHQNKFSGNLYDCQLKFYIKLGEISFFLNASQLRKGEIWVLLEVCG